MCEYWKTCKYYDSTSVTCTKTAGSYYSSCDKAGCWRENHASLKKTKMIKIKMQHNGNYILGIDQEEKRRIEDGVK